MNILSKLSKNSVLQDAGLLSESDLFNSDELTDINIPLVNIALSAKLDGGLASGYTAIAGESKSFKTVLALLLVKAYLDKYEDAAVLWYNSEFGAPKDYFTSAGIDINRVHHAPVGKVEDLIHDIMKQLSEIKKEDKVIILVDSFGNLASRKEVNDAIAGKDTVDMTRAKQLKALFRMVTTEINMKDIPMIGISHVYDEITGRPGPGGPKKKVSGGTGGIYAADTILLISKSALYEGPAGKEVKTGNMFKIKVEKSRFTKENTVFPLAVRDATGVNKWAGLFEIAVDCGFIAQSGAWYQTVDNDGVVSEKKVRRKDIDNAEFWKTMIHNEAFKKAVNEKYGVAYRELISNDIGDIIEETSSEEETTEE